MYRVRMHWIVLKFIVQMWIGVYFGLQAAAHVLNIRTEGGRQLGEKIHIYCQVDKFSSYLSLETKTTIIYCPSPTDCLSNVQGYGIDREASNDTWFVFYIQTATLADVTEWKCRDQDGVKSTPLLLNVVPEEINAGPEYSPQGEKVIFPCLYSSDTVYMERFDNGTWTTISICSSKICECQEDHSVCVFDKDSSRYTYSSATTKNRTMFRCGHKNDWQTFTYNNNKDPTDAPRSTCPPHLTGYTTTILLPLLASRFRLLS